MTSTRPAYGQRLPDCDAVDWSHPLRSRPRSYAGYTHVLDADAGAASDVEPVSDNIRAYADAAAANGVGIIWHIGSRNTISDAERNAAPRAFISEMRSHPATLACYIADEPPAENEAVVEAWAQEIERIDPNHPTFIVSYGWDAESWRSAAAPFLDAGNGIDYIGGDVYPIKGDNPDLLSVKKVIGAVGEQARASGKQPWAILQAFPWSEVWPCGGPYVSSDEDYLADGWCKTIELDRWPTRNEMLTMRDYALEGNPAMITWFIWSTMREEAQQRGINWRDYGPWLDLQAVINAPYTPRATPRDTTTTSRSSSPSSSRAALRLSTRPRKRVVKAAGKASVRVRVRNTAAVTAKAANVTVSHPAKTTYAGASRKAKRTGSSVHITLGKIA